MQAHLDGTIGAADLELLEAHPKAWTAVLLRLLVVVEIAHHVFELGVLHRQAAETVLVVNGFDICE